MNRNNATETLAIKLCNIFSIKPVAADIGAAGELHAPYQNLLNIDSKILMIEPGNERFDKLTKKYGKFSNVNLHKVGLWDKSGTFNLHFSDTRGASLYRPDLTLCSKYVNEHLNMDPTGLIVDVGVLKASEFFSANLNGSNLNLIKLDTQGCELDIMRDLTGDLGETMCVYTEAPLSARYIGQPSVGEYIDFFTSRGFDIFDITLNKALRTRLPSRSEFLRERFGIHGDPPSSLKGRLMDGDLLFFRIPEENMAPRRASELALAYCIYGYHLEAFCLLEEVRSNDSLDEIDIKRLDDGINALVQYIRGTRTILHRSRCVNLLERIAIRITKNLRSR